MNDLRLIYWRLFNFLTRRVLACSFLVGGIVLFIASVPNVFPGGTVQYDGQATDDMGFRVISVLFPLIVVVLGIFLFRVKPYYPHSISLRANDVED